MAVVENGITYDRKLPFSEYEIGNATHLTLNQIGQETKDDFTSNPAEAIEAIEVLDNGVKTQEKIKEGQTQGEE